MITMPRWRTALAVVVLSAGALGAGLLGQASRAGAVSASGATIMVQTMDSCKQTLGGAAYSLTGGGVSMGATTPAGHGSLTSTGCPLPHGNCSAGGCTSFTGVPAGSYVIATTATPPPNSSNPEGYAPCEGGSACRSQVANVTVSAGGGVSASVVNVYPDGTTTTFTFSGTSGDPVVFHDFGLAAPGSGGNAQCDGDSDADDHLTGSPSGHCAYPEAQESSACQPFPWSCGLGSTVTAARRLLLTVPSRASAFTPATVAVTALNGTTPDATYTGTVALSSSSDRLAGLPAAYTFTAGDAGVHVFSVIFRHPGSQALSATDTGRSGPASGTATIPVVSDNASFVENLYHDVLGRLGADSEVGYWSGRMAGGMSREAVAAVFSTTPEVEGRDVDAAYQRLVGHAADPGGRAYWVSRLSTGAYDEDLLAALAASPAYYASHGRGTDKGFVGALYQDMLGRPGSSGEIAGWVSGGAIAGRAAVAAAFAFSHEHHRGVVAAPTTGWYARYLGRPADGGGAEYWAGVLDRGTHDEVGAAVFTSGDEYYGKAAAY
jgi:Domain of unknown function (DUF4214)